MAEFVLGLFAGAMFGTCFGALVMGFFIGARARMHP